MARHQSLKQRAQNYAFRHGITVEQATEWLKIKKQLFKEIIGNPKK